MSIDKIIERVKKLAEHKRYAKYPEIVQAQVKKDDGAEEIYSPDTDFLVLAANSIMSIITAYEESQKAKEEFKTLLVSSHNCIKHLVKDHKEELETANKRIAELGKEADDAVKNQASIRDQRNWDIP